MPETTELSEVTTIAETETITVTSLNKNIDDVYNSVQSCNATLTVILAVTIIILVTVIASKILKALGFN